MKSIAEGRLTWRVGQRHSHGHDPDATHPYFLEILQIGDSPQSPEYEFLLQFNCRHMEGGGYVPEVQAVST